MTTREWIMILGMVAVTFSVRYFLLGLAERIRMPRLMEASLAYIPPAVLIAIILPAILLPKGHWDVSLQNPYLTSSIIAAIAGVLSKRLLVTIAVGLAAFFALKLI